MRLIRRLFVLICLLATAFTVWALIYARREGFTKSWRRAIETEFSKRGYHVEIGKITLGAFRGLVAEDVRFFQGPEKKEETAFVDDVFLDVDLSNIFHSKKLSINTLDVQDAMVSLPVTPGDRGNRQRLQINHLSGRIEVTESMIQIVRAEAEVSGIDISVKGSLLRPPGDIAPKDKETSEEELAELSKRRTQIQEIFREIGEYEFPDGKPTLEIDFRGDLRDLSTTTATVRLEASRIRKKGQPYEISSLNASAEFNGSDERLELTEFLLQDRLGDLRGEAKWNREKDRIDFKVDSSIDVASLLGLYYRDKRLGEVVFYKSPHISAEGHLSLDEMKNRNGPRSRSGGDGEGDADSGQSLSGFYFPGEVLGEIHLDKFVSRGAVFNGLDCGYSLSANRVYVRNLRLDHKTGVAFLNMKFEPGRGDETLQYQAEIKLDPMVFRPFLGEDARRFLDAWSFDESSGIYLAAVGQGPNMYIENWKNKGVIDLRNFKLNGVGFEELETDLETNPQFQYFRNIKMKRKDGSILAELAQHNIETRQWEVKGVVSTTNLVEGARAFSRPLAMTLTRYRMDSPPTIHLSGILDGRRQVLLGDSPRNTDVKISFECEGEVRTDFLGKSVRLNSPSGQLDVYRSRVHLTHMDAGVFGGKVSLEYDAKDVRSSAKPYDATLNLKRVPLESIIQLYDGSNSAKGELNMALNLSGNEGDVTTLNGHGSADISDGDLFGVPLFGPLSKLITEATPGQDRAGYSIAREARATFQIENGVIATDNLEAEAKAFKLKAKGKVDCRDQSVAIDATAFYRDNLAGAILSPVSELLTYSCSGTVGRPEWKPKHISNMAKLPGQIVSGVGEIPVKGLQMIGRSLTKQSSQKEESKKPESKKPANNGTTGKPGALKLQGFFRKNKGKPRE